MPSTVNGITTPQSMARRKAKKNLKIPCIFPLCNEHFPTYGAARLHYGKPGKCRDFHDRISADFARTCHSGGARERTDDLCSDSSSSKDGSEDGSESDSGDDLSLDSFLAYDDHYGPCNEGMEEGVEGQGIDLRMEDGDDESAADDAKFGASIAKALEIMANACLADPTPPAFAAESIEGAAKIYPDDGTEKHLPAKDNFRKAQEEDEFAEIRKTRPFHPFDNYPDYQLGSFIDRIGISMKEKEEFFNLDLVSSYLPLQL